MNKIIKEQLTRIENENNVKILYAIESGSRGWGFESKDSDFDVRFIYLHPVEWYLSIFEQRDIIEIPVNKVLDVNGWGLQKVMQHINKSNPSILEWLSSPIVYRENPNFAGELKNVADKYFSSVHAAYHYIGLAKKCFSGMMDADNIKIKKLFYVIRPILCCMWIEKYNTIPPMNIQDLMKGIILDNKIKNIIDELIVVKADCIESDTIKQPCELISFLDGKIKYYDSYVKSIKNEKERDISMLNQFFQETLNECYGGKL